MTIEEIKLKISKLGVEYENTEAELEWVFVLLHLFLEKGLLVLRFRILESR